MRFDIEWIGPDDNAYAVQGFVTGPVDYDESSWSTEKITVEGPEGLLDWGDCSDVDQANWPDWAHTMLVHSIDNMLEARAFGAFGL